MRLFQLGIIMAALFTASPGSAAVTYYYTGHTFDPNLGYSGQITGKVVFPDPGLYYSTPITSFTGAYHWGLIDYSFSDNNGTTLNETNSLLSLSGGVDLGHAFLFSNGAIVQWELVIASYGMGGPINGINFFITSAPGTETLFNQDTFSTIPPQYYPFLSFMRHEVIDNLDYSVILVPAGDTVFKSILVNVNGLDGYRDFWVAGTLNIGQWSLVPTDSNTVPEPTTLTLLGIGALGMMCFGRGEKGAKRGRKGVKHLFYALYKPRYNRLMMAGFKIE